MSAALATFALPAAALATWALIRSPLGRSVVAEPRGDRWHERQTPLLGGLGLFVGLLAGVGAALAADALEPSKELFGILGGCAIVFGAGLADDLRALPPVAKLASQVAAAALVIATGLQVQIVSNDVLATAIAVLWLVGMTNAFTLLDNMDGLAATMAAIACAYFAIDASTTHSNRLVLVVALAVGLACAGFLPFNLRPGKPAAIFMGDSGSQLLGFALAALGLSASWKAAGTTVATLFLPILVLAVPILDTALVTIVRILEGRPIYQGGRDHTSHRLVYRGLSEKRAVLLLGLIAAGLGGTSLAYNNIGSGAVTLVGVLLTFALLVQFATFLSDLEHAPAGRMALVFVHTRRLVEVLVDFALVGAAFSASYLLFVHGSGTTYQKHIFVVTLPALLAARFFFFIPFGLYRGVWRYAGAREAVATIAAVGLSELVAYVFITATQPWGDFPQSVFVVDWLLCTILVGASRLGERALFPALVVVKGREGQRPAPVRGARPGGRSLLRELRETPGEHVVGFVDDDSRLRRRRLQGVPVLGGADDIERILVDARPDLVLVTIPDAPRERLDFVVYGCAQAGVTCRFVRRHTDLDPRRLLRATAQWRR